MQMHKNQRSSNSQEKISFRMNRSGPRKMWQVENSRRFCYDRSKQTNKACSHFFTPVLRGEGLRYTVRRVPTGKFNNF